MGMINGKDGVVASPNPCQRHTSRCASGWPVPVERDPTPGRNPQCPPPRRRLSSATAGDHFTKPALGVTARRVAF